MCKMKRLDYTRAKEKMFSIEMSRSTTVYRGVDWSEYGCLRRQYLFIAGELVAWARILAPDEDGHLFAKDSCVIVAGGILELIIDPEYQEVTIIGDACDALFREYLQDPESWIAAAPTTRIYAEPLATRYRDLTRWE